MILGECSEGAERSLRSTLQNGHFVNWRNREGAPLIIHERQGKSPCLKIDRVNYTK